MVCLELKKSVPKDSYASLFATHSSGIGGQFPLTSYNSLAFVPQRFFSLSCNFFNMVHSIDSLT